MITEQTRRRRRGRQIRKARRIRASCPVRLRPALDWTELIWERIRAAVREAVHFVTVLGARLTPLAPTPRDGARRQLLSNGRKP